MKHDIIKTENYLLVVDESKIKGWYYDAHINKVKHSGGAEYGENSITKNIISHLPLNGSPILEGVDLLPPLEVDNSLGTPLVQYIFEKHNQDRVMGFCDGYKKAKEKYKYTEEDLRNALFYALYHPKEDGVISITKDFIVRKSIQSLPQAKMPIGFECEIEDKIALDGHTIIGTEPKTTTTSEGHTQWEGTYTY